MFMRSILQRLSVPVLFASGSIVLALSQAQGAIFSYYIGTDKLSSFTTGTYAGLANPNHQRLTFLLAHSYPVTPPNPGDTDATVNHFHTLGSYRLSGSAAAPVVIFGNPRVPEGTRPALPLQNGTGAFAGKLVSAVLGDPGLTLYSDLQISPLSQLRAYHENGTPGEPEDYMYFGFNNPNPALATAASNQRYSTTSIAGADVHFELVSISNGLHIASGMNMNIMSTPGDEWHLGDGDSFSVFRPTFWTDASANPGTYSATFKLTDENGLFGDSGEFRFEFAVIPEPSSALMLGSMGFCTLLRRRRR
jgi:hypothetical protein